jgi:hypothetical protein
MNMQNDMFQQLTRIVLYHAAGALVTSGILSQEMAQQLAGSILGIITVGWWWFWNRKQS